MDENRKRSVWLLDRNSSNRVRVPRYVTHGKEQGNPVNPDLIHPLYNRGGQAFGGIVEQTATTATHNNFGGMNV